MENGEDVLNTDKLIPSAPMRWHLQTETKAESTGASGNLNLDWVAVYKYNL